APDVGEIVAACRAGLKPSESCGARCGPLEPAEVTEVAEAAAPVAAAEVATPEVASGIAHVAAHVASGIAHVTTGHVGVAHGARLPRGRAGDPGHTGEHRAEQHHRAEAPGACYQRGLPPRLGVPAPRDGTTGDPATGVVVRSPVVGLGRGFVVLALDVHTAM